MLIKGLIEEKNKTKKAAGAKALRYIWAGIFREQQEDSQCDQRVRDGRATGDGLVKEGKGQIMKDLAGHSKTLGFSSECGEKSLEGV